MDSWVRSQILYLWILVVSGSVSMETSSPLYTVHRSRVQFHQAVERCLPGVLTTLATQQEVTAVLGLISRSGFSGGESTFWIGLKKAKNQCVLPTLPLRGFRWLDHSQDSQIGRWAKEPQDACTTVRCVTLQVQLDLVNQSSVTHWGLVPVSCRENSLHQFICKLTDQQARPTAAGHPEPLEPANPGSRPAEPENPGSTPDEPAQPGSTLEEPAQPGSTPEKPARPETRPTDPQTLEPVLDRTGPDSKWEAGPDPCQRPVIPRVRSYIPDPNNRSRIQVECWTSVHLLYCGGSPTAWRHEDGSPANYSVLCRPCGAGFLKDASGHCVDVDECAVAKTCRSTCLNTQGSFRCVCLDPDGKHLDEGSAACANAQALDEGGVLVPVLAAVAALVLLAVVVMVTVMCCLRRRAKKRALEDEADVAMENTNSRR